MNIWWNVCWQSAWNINSKRGNIRKQLVDTNQNIYPHKALSTTKTFPVTGVFVTWWWWGCVSIFAGGGKDIFTIHYIECRLLNFRKEQKRRAKRAYVIDIRLKFYDYSNRNRILKYQCKVVGPYTWKLAIKHF